MVSAANGAAAAAANNSSSTSGNPVTARRPPLRAGRGSTRTASVGSFRAGSPLPTLRSTNSASNSRANSRRRTAGLRRVSTAHHYHTFPTPPPKNPGRRHGSDPESPNSLTSLSHPDHSSTPLPARQLALLAVLSLAEQTALNSISPYLPEMVQSFPGVHADEVGLYVGLLASAFALAQLATNLLWGYLSDVVGRKPVMLIGTSLLCLCFAAFGFCTRYWHIILVHVLMGLLNGNAAVVPTCLGELTDRSNQSRAFTWLPVVYSLGSITGPALGGLLVGDLERDRYPFLAPNILGASLLAVSVVVLALWFEETLDDESEGLDWSEAFGWMCCCVGRSKKGQSGSWIPRWLGGPETDEADDGARDDDQPGEDAGLLGGGDADGETDGGKGPLEVSWRQVFNRTTIVLLVTQLIFQLSNSSFNSLYPIFASAEEPTGRDLPADVIGISLSVAGFFTIMFQLFIFGPLKSRLGNVGSYRGSLMGFAITLALMPLVGYRTGSAPLGIGSSQTWLYVELGAILIVKNICAVGGLSSVMLLVCPSYCYFRLVPKLTTLQITNSAPSHATLGTLNGVAQTLSAAGRSFGPFLSGSIFTLSMRIQPKGEALAWGLFAGIALVGWLGSYFIRGEGLESTDDGFEIEDEDEEHLSDDQML